jgi:hypothetical protein
LVFLFYFRLIALAGIVPFLIHTADILLHPFSPALNPTLPPFMRVWLGLLAAPLTLAVALLCIRRIPDNLIGWLLVMFSYGMSIQVIRADFLPIVPAVILGNILIAQFWFAFLITPLYFPDGRLFPPGANRWGNILISVIMFFTLLVSTVSNPTYTWGSDGISVSNPLLVFAWNYTIFTIPAMITLILAGILVVVLRYRAGRGVEQLQMRWLLFGVMLQGLLTIFTFWAPAWMQGFASWVTSLYSLIIPLAVGIAVLRYRLYDIDLVIRRTLQYALLTFLLGLVYFGGVTLLQTVFTSLAGRQSPLAVVLSTLAIAALFNPLRRQVQALIDRYFYRQKYDGDLILNRFTVSLQNEVDADALRRRLLETVSETLQPELLDLWVRKP